MKKTFIIKGNVWLIEEKEQNIILEEYRKRQPNAYACFGLTFYKDHKIWIAKDLCKDEKVRTLKHELTHCYIWENGFYHIDFNDEEIICDFVASIYNFIDYVIGDYFV